MDVKDIRSLHTARVLAKFSHVGGDTRTSFLYQVWTLLSRLPRDTRTFSFRPTNRSVRVHTFYVHLRLTISPGVPFPCIDPEFT